MLAKGMAIVLLIIAGLLVLFILSLILAFPFTILKRILDPSKSFFDDWFKEALPFFRWELYGVGALVGFLVLSYVIGAIVSMNMEMIRNVGVLVGVIGGIVAVITAIVKLFEKKK